MDGPAVHRLFSIDTDSFFIGRSDPSQAWNPAVDLSPDMLVSRRHANIYLKNGLWWIKDLDSVNSTILEGRDIQQQAGPAQLRIGDRVTTGSTTWILEAPDPVHNEFDIEIQTLPAGYSAFISNIPLITCLTIRNIGKHLWPPSQLSLHLRGYGPPLSRHMPAIDPAGQVVLKDIGLKLDIQRLRSIPAMTSEDLEIRINNRLVTSVTVPVLSLYEWSAQPGYRKALASFVMPAHPIVCNISVMAQQRYAGNRFVRKCSDAAEKAGELLMAVYLSLSRDYTISYTNSAPSHTPESQFVRIPDHLISNPRERTGMGNCLDIALLIAGCLENFRLHPLVIVVMENGSVFHALTGCWKVATERYEPVITDYDRLNTAMQAGDLLLLEPTGVTDRWGKRLSFEEAVARAREMFQEERFLFAVDMAAARPTVPPLRFAMNPHVSTILSLALELALRQGTGMLEARHVASAILQSHDPGTLTILSRLGIDGSDLGTCTNPVPSAVTPSGPPPSRTRNYRLILSDAHIIAGDCGKAGIDVEHLFYAMLMSPSRGVDQVLARLGCKREEVRRRFEVAYEWTSAVERTRFSYSL